VWHYFSRTLGATFERYSLLLIAVTSTCQALYLFLLPFVANSFGWRLYKRVGANIQLQTMYRAAHVFFSVLKLDLAIWGVLVLLASFYLFDSVLALESVLNAAALLLGLLWGYVGYQTVRRELPRLFIAWAASALLAPAYVAYKFVCLNTSSYYTDYPRTTYLQFYIVGGAAVALRLVTVTAALRARANFGLGLAAVFAEARAGLRPDGMPVARGGTGSAPEDAGAALAGRWAAAGLPVKGGYAVTSRTGAVGAGLGLGSAYAPYAVNGDAPGAALLGTGAGAGRGRGHSNGGGGGGGAVVGSAGASGSGYYPSAVNVDIDALIDEYSLAMHGHGHGNRHAAAAAAAPGAGAGASAHPYHALAHDEGTRGARGASGKGRRSAANAAGAGRKPSRSQSRSRGDSDSKLTPLLSAPSAEFIAAVATGTAVGAASAAPVAASSAAAAGVADTGVSGAGFEGGHQRSGSVQIAVVDGAGHTRAIPVTATRYYTESASVTIPRDGDGNPVGSATTPAAGAAAAAAESEGRARGRDRAPGLGTFHFGDSVEGIARGSRNSRSRSRSDGAHLAPPPEDAADALPRNPSPAAARARSRSRSKTALASD
jgi:hypothetical protein